MKRSLLAITLLCSISSAYAKNRLPNTLPLVASSDMVVFPNQIAPLYITDQRIIKGIEKAYSANGLVLILASRPHTSYREYFDFGDMYKIGTAASVLQITPTPEGGAKVLVQGVARASVHELFVKNNVIHGDVQPLEYKPSSPQEVEKLFTAIRELIGQASHYNLGEFAVSVENETKPEKLAHIVVTFLNLQGERAQGLLECASHVELLEELYSIIAQQFSSLIMKEAVLKESMSTIKESEKKYYLQEQLKTIKKQLGTDEATDLATKLGALPLPDEVRKEVDRQLGRLEQLPASMPESSIIQGYLEWILELPWGVETDDNLDILHAKQILNDDHFGLKEIKERILDFIAIRKLTKDNKAPILCFVGPPGTGKTSLAKSIARSLGRNFIRISVGGVHDESEIRGHRRTYVAAMAGRILEGMRKAGSMNPVILIDEIDKVGNNSMHGDPSSALLEVLDPEQNDTFRDHYLGTPFDLSKVLFIATANTLNTIPRPLLDRMEIIHISGYSLEEKSAIAKNYLIKKAITSSGLTGHPVTFSDEVLTTIIEHYTMESGVRELERVLKKLCSKAARVLVEENKLISFTVDNLEEHLGAKIFINTDFKETSQVGITNGLAGNSYGCSMLKVEALLMPGKGKLQLTGSLGKVIKESAETALSYTRAHADEYDIPKEMFTDYDMHIHFPAGATKKDGPSGGIALLSSIVSAFTDRKVNGDYAMTGEINLRGNVTAIGGVKEKIIAAKRHGISHVILPQQNKKDLAEIEDAVKGIDVIFVSHANEVLSHVLMPK